jgi:hypothetical protein
VQLSLNFLHTPPRPEAKIWERLDDQHRRTVIEQLACLLVKATLASARQEPADE